MRDKTTILLFYHANMNKRILFILFHRLIDRNKYKSSRKCKRNDDRSVNSFGIYQYNVA